MGKSYLEKSLKRFLKRKVRITLGFIVAFLLSCNFVSADEIYIVDDNSGKIEISNDIEGNTFDNNTYTNNNDIVSGNAYGIRVVLKNNGLNGIINNKKIELDNPSGIPTGISIKVTTENQNNGVGEVLNNGIIIVKGRTPSGIETDTESTNSTMVINSIVNKGIIQAEGDTAKGIHNQSDGTKIGKIANEGIIDSELIGIWNESDENSIIGELLNKGTVYAAKTGISSGTSTGAIKIDKIYNEGIIGGGNLQLRDGTGLLNIRITSEYLGNTGIIYGKGHTSGTGISIESALKSSSEISKLENKGFILGAQLDESKNNNSTYSSGIYIYHNNNKIKVDNIINDGIISAISAANVKSTGIIYISSTEDSNISNNGVISGHSIKGNTNGFGIYLQNSNAKNISNKGIIYGNTNAVAVSNGSITSFENYGLLINKNESANIVEGTNVTNYGIMFTVKDDGTYEIKGNAQDNEDVINAKLNDDSKGTGSISAENYDGKYINGITDTLKVDGKAEIKNSVINGYTNAVVFEAGNSLTLNKTIVNGGLNNITENDNENLGTTILGSDGADTLILENETVINGDILLGAGADTLTLDNTVQLNGNLNGGDGDEEDTLTFSKKPGSDSSINILYNISDFENVNINSDVTLFENIKVTDAGNITIGENGNLILRLNTTDTNGISHALSDNGGIISSNGGKLVFVLNGLGDGTEISLGQTTLADTMKGSNSEGVEYEEDLTLDTTSFLYDIERIENNDSAVKVVVSKDLPSIDDKVEEPYNYEKLNKIYHSIVSSSQDGEFTGVTEDNYGYFLEHLHDIYAGNPYAFSSELSRKTLGIMRNLADKDLKPELNKWAVYGGFTHVDGGTENSYYGKGYYTYDIGSRDIKADTKITGGYAKAEFGKSETLTTGIIFGGNNSETEIGASKVEGDSFYFGAYAKKYINDFRFTLGAGFEHGDYKADRMALGYSGITETRKYSENYHDRGFDIYGNAKYSKEIGNELYFEPSMTLSYTYIDQDGAKENGILAIETDSKYFDYSSAEVNLDLRKAFGIHSFTAGVSYERMLSGYDEEFITGRMIGGSDFDILVPEKEKDIFSLNAKYELETERGFIFDVKGSYRFEHGDNNTEWTVGTGIGYKF